MIRSEEVFPIGRITRTHGLQGEVEFQFTDDAFERGTSPYLVLLIDGIFVPFFLQEHRFKNQESALLLFEEVQNEAQARKLVGLSVYYPKAALPTDGPRELRSLQALVGYTVLLPDVEESHAEGLATRLLGEVQYVAETNSNAVLTVSTDEGEVLLPFHQDFLLDWNPNERHILLQLPEGILDLNS